jgi:hypothetical protein
MGVFERWHDRAHFLTFTAPPHCAASINSLRTDGDFCHVTNGRKQKLTQKFKVVETS